MLSVGWC
jgi:hypothetical protein